MSHSRAWERGKDAGYDTANYVYAYGGLTEVSYYLYAEADGTREEYSEGFADGVEAYEDERDDAGCWCADDE